MPQGSMVFRFTEEEIFKLRAVLDKVLQLYLYNPNCRGYKDTLRAYAMLELLNGLTAKRLMALRRKDVSNLNPILEEYFKLYPFGPDDIIFPMAQINVIYRTVQRWLLSAEINQPNFCVKRRFKVDKNERNREIDRVEFKAKRLILIKELAKIKRDRVDNNKENL